MTCVGIGTSVMSMCVGKHSAVSRSYHSIRRSINQWDHSSARSMGVEKDLWHQDIWGLTFKNIRERSYSNVLSQDAWGSTPDSRGSMSIWGLTQGSNLFPAHLRDVKSGLQRREIWKHTSEFILARDPTNARRLLAIVASVPRVIWMIIWSVTRMERVWMNLELSPNLEQGEWRLRRYLIRIWN